jgi:hypothetical protein
VSSSGQNGSGNGSNGDDGDGVNKGRGPRRVMTVVVETRELVREHGKLIEQYWQALTDDLTKILEMLDTHDAIVRDIRTKIVKLDSRVIPPPASDPQKQP